MPRSREYDEPEDDFEDDLEGGFEDEEEEELDDEPEDDGDYADDEPEADERAGRRQDRGLAEQINRVKSQMGRHTQNVLNDLRANGLDWQDGRVVVRNAQVASGLLGQGGQAEPEEETDPYAELGEMPDLQLDPDGFHAWLQKRDQIAVQVATKTVRQQLDQELAPIRGQVNQTALRGALELAEEVLPDYGFEHLLDHPDFDKAFSQALQASGTNPAQWSDRKLLGRIAGILNVDLRDTAPKSRRRSSREEDAPPRRRGSDQSVGRSALARDGYVSVGASRGRGRVPAGDGPSREERANARHLGISVEEYRALGSEDYDTYQKYQQRQSRRRR